MRLQAGIRGYRFLRVGMRMKTSTSKQASLGKHSERAPDAPASRSPLPVDVIVAVYGVAAEFEGCLGQLFAHTAWTARRLVIVDDLRSGFPPTEHLEHEAAKHRVPMLILRNTVLRGFVGSVKPAQSAIRRSSTATPR